MLVLAPHERTETTTVVRVANVGPQRAVQGAALPAMENARIAIGKLRYAVEIELQQDTVAHVGLRQSNARKRPIVQECVVITVSAAPPPA
jgi:hypothetical protein